MNVYQLSFISADCIAINLDFVSILIVYSIFRMNKSLRSWRCYSVFRCAKNKLVTSLIIFLLFIIANFNDRITRRILHWMSYKYNWSVFVKRSGQLTSADDVSSATCKKNSLSSSSYMTNESWLFDQWRNILVTLYDLLSPETIKKPSFNTCSRNLFSLPRW